MIYSLSYEEEREEFAIECVGLYYDIFKFCEKMRDEGYGNVEHRVVRVWSRGVELKEMNIIVEKSNTWDELISKIKQCEIVWGFID